MRSRATLQDARFEEAAPRRLVEYHDSEEFDRIDFAMRALDRLRPKRLRIAVYKTVSTVEIETVEDLSREGYRIASVGIPPHASREHIAYALAELAGVASVPYVVRTLLALERSNPYR
ncbi:MAG TPA: hypothetical protein VM694_38370 [Polyangium sp.]|nr:hypothetical protein [Polyangium sp.]